LIVNIAVIILVIAGLVLFLGTVVGIIRFPDYYTRIHAAGKGDTLSSLLILLGLAIYNLHDFSLASVLVSLKIGLIFIFIFLTAPTTTHALMEAGYRYGAKPWTRAEEEDRKAIALEVKEEDEA
jgi:multicomponent Na+:H+ antiporter subunit G